MNKCPMCGKAIDDSVLYCDECFKELKLEKNTKPQPEKTAKEVKETKPASMPSGVLVISILLIISAILSIVSAFYVLEIIEDSSFAILMVSIYAVLALGYILLSYFLSKGKAWASKATQTLAVINIIFYLFSLATGTGLFGLIVNIAIFVYLGYSEECKVYFRE